VLPVRYRLPRDSGIIRPAESTKNDRYTMTDNAELHVTDRARFFRSSASSMCNDLPFDLKYTVTLIDYSSSMALGHDFLSVAWWR